MAGSARRAAPGRRQRGPFTAMELSDHRLSRMTTLDFGIFDVGPGRRLIPIPGYLLETDRGARVLVDTGFDPLYASDPEAAEARDALSSFGRLVGHSPARTLPGQLARLGLAPADITSAVLTHSHIDHVGGLPLLSCPVWLTRTERAEPRPLYWGGRRPMDWPDLPYRTIESETEIARGIRLIPTPGHTPGHLSLALSLPGGRGVILAADAINRATEPAEGFADAMDPALAARSAARLFAMARQSGAKMMYGHEPLHGAA